MSLPTPSVFSSQRRMPVLEARWLGQLARIVAAPRNEVSFSPYAGRPGRF